MREKSEQEWRASLTPEQFRILREKGTEAPFTGEYDELFEPGEYQCAGCGAAVFASDAKFNSGCGWPAFDRSVALDAVRLQSDASHGMERVEVLCPHCGGHLGHVFKDGPTETGERFCINSAALKFQKKDS
ncbi:MAG: peptide-methionine (R)-S-oxide reductase MsrB [Patescibacteria group bacterium]